MIPPRTTKTIRAFVNHLWQWNTTDTVTQLETFTDSANLLISHSVSTTNAKKVAVGVTITTESSYLIKKNTQIAKFSVVIPEQSKYIKLVDMAILSMITESKLDLTAYLIEFFRTKNPSSKTKLSGSRHLKILASRRITPENIDQPSQI